MVAALAVGTAPQGLSCGHTVARLPVADGAPSLDATLRTEARAVARTWMRSHPPDTVAWNWGEGVLVFGLDELAMRGDLPDVRTYVDAYFAHHQRAGIDVRWSDDTTPALAAAERWSAGDARYRTLVEQVVAYLERAPKSTPRGLLLHLGNTRMPLIKGLFPDAWIDSVFHTVPTLMRHAETSDSPGSRSLALTQLSTFADLLQDPATGLFAHAYVDGPAPRQVPAFGRQLFWARGNGWMLASLVDALCHLPGGHDARDGLLARTHRLAAALIDAQDPETGLFHTLLLDRSSYLETAGSALILYALARGVRAGLLGQRAREAALRGRPGLLGMLRRRGVDRLVVGTSLGTNPVPNLYAITPTAAQISYGVGAWLLAASQLEGLREPTHARP